MQIFVIMWATSGISAKSLYRRLAGQRIVLRFDAVTHYGKVWVNNQEVMEHQGGYTPFEADVTPYVIAGKSVGSTVRVNNELNWQTIPPGMVITDENGKKKQSLTSMISLTTPGSIAA